MDVFDAIQLPDYSTVERSNDTQVMPSRVRQIECPILLRDSADRIQLGPD